MATPAESVRRAPCSNDVSEIRSSRYGSDVVIAQDPQAKQAGSQVSLLVNRAERGTSYVMPDLIGINGDRAVEILRERGFRVAVVGSVPYPGVAAGVVLRQSPQHLRLAEAEDLGSFYAGLQAKGIQIIDPLAERPWGQSEFTVEDPDLRLKLEELQTAERPWEIMNVYPSPPHKRQGFHEVVTNSERARLRTDDA